MLIYSEIAMKIIRELLWAKKQGESITHQEALYLWEDEIAWEELVEEDYLKIEDGLVTVTKKGLTWWYYGHEEIVTA